MSSHSHSTLTFLRWLKAIRPIRRLLLSGLPLVLTTRYLAIKSLHSNDKSTGRSLNCAAASEELRPSSLWRQPPSPLARCRIAIELVAGSTQRGAKLFALFFRRFVLRPLGLRRRRLLSGRQNINADPDFLLLEPDESDWDEIKFAGFEFSRSIDRGWSRSLD